MRTGKSFCERTDRIIPQTGPVIGGDGYGGEEYADNVGNEGRTRVEENSNENGQDAVWNDIDGKQTMLDNGVSDERESEGEQADEQYRASSLQIVASELVVEDQQAA